MSLITTICNRLIRPPKKCQFSKVCILYQQNSYNCNKEGSSYCGEYRKLLNNQKGEVKCI